MKDDNSTDVAQKIWDGMAHAVSDESYLTSTGNGAAGYVLILGCSLLMSAYRRKLGGLHGIIRILEDLCIQYMIMDGHVTIGCDSQEALWQAPSSNSPISPSVSDFNLVATIRWKTQTLPIQTSMKWIKGHKYSFPSNSKQLNLVWARLNISMDLLEKQHRALHDRHTHPDDLHYDIDGEPCQLILDGHKVSKNFKDRRLFKRCVTSAHQEYWKSRQLFATTPADLHTVAIKKAQHSHS
eukprot:scaffold232585_cov77-Attheya_sp.AAC.5